MKTDRFEELLRKKLENYTPDYREEDLDRMFSNIQRHTSPSFWSQYGKFLSYGLAGITMAGLLFTVFFQYNQNQKLNEEITLLQKSEPKTEVVTKTIVKTDTVFITKYITVPNNETEGKVYVQNEIENAINKPEIDQIKEESVIGESVSENTAKTSDNGSINNLILKGEKTIFTKNNQENRKNSQKSEIKTSDIAQSNITESSNNQHIISGNSAIVNSTNAIVGNSETTVSTIPEKSIRDYSFNTLSIKNWKEYYSTYDITKHKIRYRYKAPAVVVVPKRRPRYDYQFPDISLKNTKYRIGIGSEFGHEKIGLNLWNEWLLNKHFSLNFGIGAKKMESDEFDDEREYNFKYGEKGITELPEKGQTKNKDFRDRHLPGLTPNNEIRDIHLINEIVNIPLSLTYRGNLWRDYKWTLTAGTELDLYVKEKVDFGFQITNPLFTDKEYIKSSKYRILEPTLFNNYFVSAGLEKQFGKYVLQLSPYFTQKIKEANYRRCTFDYGFRFNVLYQFGKK